MRRGLGVGPEERRDHRDQSGEEGDDVGQRSREIHPCLRTGEIGCAPTLRLIDRPVNNPLRQDFLTLSDNALNARVADSARKPPPVRRGPPARESPGAGGHLHEPVSACP
ncbi:hypothetical protein Mame01_42670 [Microbispora amethystogenes]|nr:hypothetical protein Mame01_42670 [Microbispora amethystogenes]